MNNEIWKQIDFSVGTYEVSTFGNVRSIERNLTRSNGRKHFVKSKVLRPSIDGCGYNRIAMPIQGKLVTKKVHRLVAEAFIPNPDNLPQVNHINGDKTDNRIENLEWVTNDENIAHAIRTGLIKMEYTDKEKKRSINKVIKKGSLNGYSKLSEVQVIEIRKKYIPGVYTREMLAKEFDVKMTTIKDVVNKKSWKHI